MSLRLRLLIATVVAVLVGLVVADVVTYALVSRAQLSLVDDELQRAHGPSEQIAQADSRQWVLIPEIAPGLFVAITDADGTPLFITPARQPGEGDVSIDLAGVDRSRRYQTVTSTDGDRMRVRSDRLANGTTLIFGRSMHEIDDQRAKLLTGLVVASAAAMAIVAALAWWLVRLGLRPLGEVERSAAAITDTDLEHRRVPMADQPTEVGSLARTLNGMLDRLDAARVEREETMAELQASESRMRQFVADASHELRTPMAATAAYAELFETGARDRPGDLARSMAGIRTETARMAELVEDLLLLARLDERRPLAREQVDLTEVLLTAIDAARALEPDRRFSPRIDGVITVEGDPARLRQVVDNLLANVRTHAPADATCTISLTSDETATVLVIADTGPGLTDEQMLHLGDRFYRIDNARTRASGGSGLGLSIATAIMDAHGGTMTPSHNEPSGLKWTVRLPASTDRPADT